MAKFEKISDSLFKLFEPAPPHRISIDIIFFHGLQFDAHEGRFQPTSDGYLSTWRSGDALQEVWPERWLPAKYPGARILMVSYDASIKTTGTEGMMDMHQIGENLLEEILSVRRRLGKECPVVFVGHSFGGLVIKQVCWHAYKNKEKPANGRDVRKFLESIRGIFFYGTPHRGFDPAVLGKVLSRISTNKTLLSFVEVLGKDATRLHENFEQRRREYNWLIYGLGELHAITLEGQSNILVPEASSRYGHGENYMSVKSDHFYVCRPLSTTCNRYLRLVHLIDAINVEKSQLERRENVCKNVVGVESFQTEVLKLLEEHTFLGFSGMGGVGKTTMARLTFNTLSPKFEYTCFVSEVKLIQGNKEEIKEKIWKNMHLYDHSVPRGTWSEVSGKKLLLVFDDIDKAEHVDLLQTIADDNASKESKFIITSRDGELLRRFHDVGIYSVPVLKHEAARELFIAHAFRERKEPPEHLKHRVEEVVKRCAGLPLTLEVLGKYLGGVDDERIWDENLVAVRNAGALHTLEERLWRKLRLSYNDLKDQEKDMFLDISSFLLHEGCSFSFEEIRSAWSSEDTYVQTRWKKLVDRSLVHEEEIDKHAAVRNRLVIETSRRESRTKLGVGFKKVQMHEHLRSLGQRIAEESGRYISLIDSPWGDNTIQPEKVAALRVQFSIRLSGDIDGRDENSCSLCKLLKLFSQLKAMRFLELTMPRSRPCKRCKTLGGFSLPSGLLMLQWVGSNVHLKLPLEASFCKSLVVLRLYRDDDCSLDILSSQACAYLSKLERLTLANCSKLVNLPDTFGKLSSLQHLEIQRCPRLERLSETFGNLNSLQHLEIQQCPRFERFPETVGNLSNLQHLEIHVSGRLERLSETFENLSSLQHLEIIGCSLERLPETFGNLSSLQHLKIQWCSLERLPETFGNLSSLQHLEIHVCDRLERLSETFGNLSSLQHLEISRCEGLERLAETFENLSSLQHLEICRCDRLERLPETFGNLSSLQHLQIYGCPQLERLPETFGNLSSLHHLQIGGSDRLERLPETFENLSSLQHLEICRCNRLERLPETFGNLSSLQHLQIYGCPQLERLPETFGNLSSLQHLQIYGCPQLERLSETFENLSSLHHLEIGGDFWELE